ncbi:uncharacterized protein LOC130678140 [Microplitis mediator]|uniref:uncharacterized protein LOC130678140 n=1 Tax=Microplitis mediator TaxID=375433 RepID=UPI00255288A0|nr:uncharacterized protein LOC130678140 [Microplitis mediator]
MLPRIKFKILKVIIIYIYLFYLLIVEANRCFNVNNYSNDIVPKYKLIKKYSRSMKSILLMLNATTLKQCQEFAIIRKAMAFNYYHHDNHKFNCQLLECPEINSFDSLVSDNKFFYYSMYPRKLLPERVRCLPRVGVFVISEESKSYREAQKSCEDINGKLAHIVSEERTQGLAKFISNNDTPVFVGLSNRRSSKEHLWKNEFDEPLNCFDYRGWNKGEPSGSRGCVGLILTKSLISDKTPAWRVLSCSQPLPFICEVLPRVRIIKND